MLSIGYKESKTSFKGEVAMDRIRVCHRCGIGVSRGSFCVNCTMELTKGLRNTSCESGEQSAIKNLSQRESMEGGMRFTGTPKRKGEFLCR